MLDTKRTFHQSEYFDRKKLEVILFNLADPKKGDFSYYQGLNYITSYFLVLFQGDELKTYNQVITMMRENYKIYLDHSMHKFKRLLYIAKKYLKIYLP